MRAAAIILAAVMLVGAGPLQAQQAGAISAARVEQVVADGWRSAPAEWQERLVQDRTMKECTEAHNAPPKPVADAIMARERASIVYPADGKFLGDWRKGERLAQSGYGMRFTDYPPTGPNGGNCYACHQLDKKELSYGTLGPSLKEYGKIRNFADADVKAVYERIYNPQASVACANMPRFGANKVLTVDQIKDIVALLMDPESPVNK